MKDTIDAHPGTFLTVDDVVQIVRDRTPDESVLNELRSTLELAIADHPDMPVRTKFKGDAKTYLIKMEILDWISQTWPRDFRFWPPPAWIIEHSQKSIDAVFEKAPDFRDWWPFLHKDKPLPLSNAVRFARSIPPKFKIDNPPQNPTAEGYQTLFDLTMGHILTMPDRESKATKESGFWLVFPIWFRRFAIESGQCIKDSFFLAEFIQPFESSAPKRKPTEAATAAKIRGAKIRRERLRKFHDKLRSGARKKNYSWADRTNRLPFDRQDLHTMFYQIHRDVALVKIGTFKDDLRAVGMYLSSSKNRLDIKKLQKILRD